MTDGGKGSFIAPSLSVARFLVFYGAAVVHRAAGGVRYMLVRTSRVGGGRRYPIPVAAVKNLK